jgi:hypothetical protein
MKDGYLQHQENLIVRLTDIFRVSPELDPECTNTEILYMLKDIIYDEEWIADDELKKRPCRTFVDYSIKELELMSFNPFVFLHKVTERYNLKEREEFAKRCIIRLEKEKNE